MLTIIIITMNKNVKWSYYKSKTFTKVSVTSSNYLIYTKKNSTNSMKLHNYVSSIVTKTIKNKIIKIWIYF